MMSGLITHVNKLLIYIAKNAALQTNSPYSATAVTSVQFAFFNYFISGYTVLSIHIFLRWIRRSYEVYVGKRRGGDS